MARSAKSTQRPTQAQIAERAYQIYLENGRRDGHAIDDWLQAEYELVAQPIRKLASMKSPPNAPAGASIKSIISVVHAALL